MLVYGPCKDKTQGQNPDALYGHCKTMGGVSTSSVNTNRDDLEQNNTNYTYQSRDKVTSVTCWIHNLDINFRNVKHINLDNIFILKYQIFIYKATT